jgi:hypothetical protein
LHKSYFPCFWSICIISAIYSQSDSTFVLPELKIYYEKNNEIAAKNLFDFYKFILEDKYLSQTPNIIISGLK